MVIAWGGWTDSGTCSASCGTGTQTKIRDCIDSNGAVVDDVDCPGGSASAITSEDCNTEPCPGILASIEN